MHPFSLSGKRALVTGGSRGIGLAIAHGLAEAGADLVLIARDRRGLEAARDTLRATGRAVEARAFDASDVEAIPRAYAEVVETCGPVDILVNCAGGIRRGPAEALSLEDWRAVVDLNLTSVFAFSQSFARERIASGKKGKIVNVASLLSERGRRGTAAYAASKGGIRQLTKTLAVEWAPYGIHVNAIGPGYIETDLTKALKEDPGFDAWVRERTPLGRWGRPEDLAAAAVFLASPGADFITGQILYVDGGWLASI